MLIAEKGEGDGYGIGAKEEFSLLELADMFGGEKTMLRPHKRRAVRQEWWILRR